jgi:cytochrome oxidase Cu insertion factor (SCO1/SenC/PrrC family)
MSYSVSGAVHARKSRRSLILVALVCALPVAVSYFMFYVWRPSGTTNYGEMLPVQALPVGSARTVDGKPFHLSDLRGRWIMLTVDRGACDDACQDKLFKMRQLRLMQGKEMGRIERVWLVADGASPDAKLAYVHDGVWAVDARTSDLPAVLSAQGDPRNYIYLVDPLGNLIMRYPGSADPYGINRDLVRLLKVSRVG